MSRIARITAAALSLASLAGAPAAAQAPSEPVDPSFRLYLAATAAAEASLRLHETAAARRWLDEAPAAHRAWEWRYLSAQADRSSARLDAHGRVLDVAVSPDGRRLATSGADGSVKLWDTGSLALERALTGHTAAVWNVAFSPDGRQLATASTDKTARVWDVATGSEVRRLEGVSRGIATVAWSRDGARLATTGWDRTPERGVWGVIKIWAIDGRLERPLEYGKKPIVTSVWSADGSRFAAGDWDDAVSVWDTTTWATARVLVPQIFDAYRAVQGIALRADDQRLAVAAKDGTLRVWSLPDAQLVHTLVGQAEGQAQWINDTVWLPGNRLAAVGNDLTLRLWDWRSCANVLSVPFAAAVYEIAWSPDGARLLAAPLDGTIVRMDASPLATR